MRALCLSTSQENKLFFKLLFHHIGIVLYMDVSSLARMFILYPSLSSFSSVTSWVGVPRECFGLAIAL